MVTSVRFDMQTGESLDPQAVFGATMEELPCIKNMSLERSVNMKIAGQAEVGRPPRQNG
jgi:hypothetical protein